MIPAPLPPDESKRLAALHALKILDTPPEERFDRITRLTRRLFDCPITLVSLIDETRQWFKSGQGMAGRETARKISFCAYTILQDEPFLVEDASLDPRFRDNPSVTSGAMVRFYAGAPLRAPDGSKIGALCVVDRRPRFLPGSEVQTLTDLAALVESELHVVRTSKTQIEIIEDYETIRRVALVDGLTQIYNRAAIMELFDKELDQAQRARTSVGAILTDIDFFKKVNDTHGHPAGDAVLKEVAARILTSMRTYDNVGRYGGEEFLVVLPGAGLDEVASTAERIRQCIAATPVRVGSQEIPVTMSFGVTATPGTREDLVARADAALYRAKHDGRNRVERGEAAAPVGS